MILSKMVCFFRAESQVESHSDRAKLALFGHGPHTGCATRRVHPYMDTTPLTMVSIPTQSSSELSLVLSLLLPIPSLLPFSVLRP